MVQRRLYSLIVISIVLPLELFAGSKPQAQDKNLPWMTARSEDIIPGIVMMKLARGVTVAEGSIVTNSGTLSPVLRNVGVTSLSQTFPSMAPATDEEIRSWKVDLSRIYYAHIALGVDPRDVARELNDAEGIEYTEPKLMNYINDTPNDPLLSNQNNAFTRMNTYNGWTIAKGSASVPIATVDGGTYWTHEDLRHPKGTGKKDGHGLSCLLLVDCSRILASFQFSNYGYPCRVCHRGCDRVRGQGRPGCPGGR